MQAVFAIMRKPHVTPDVDIVGAAQRRSAVTTRWHQRDARTRFRHPAYARKRGTLRKALTTLTSFGPHSDKFAHVLASVLRGCQNFALDTVRFPPHHI
jgi:hypothetical protein